MAYDVVWHERTQDDLGLLSKKDAVRIISKVREHLTTDPSGTGKPLKGRFKGLFRYRVGRYRVIYAIDHAERRVLVLNVADRKDVYRRSLEEPPSSVKGTGRGSFNLSVLRDVKYDVVP